MNCLTYEKEKETQYGVEEAIIQYLIRNIDVLEKVNLEEVVEIMINKKKGVDI